MPRTIPASFWRPRRKLFIQLLVFAFCFVCCLVHDSAVNYSRWLGCGVDDAGLVWIAAERSILVYRGENLLEKIPVPRQHRAYEVIRTEDAGLLILTAEGQTYRYNRDEGAFTRTEASDAGGSHTLGSTSPNGCYAVRMPATRGRPWVEYTGADGVRGRILFPLADWFFHMGTIAFGLLFAAMGIRLLFEARVLFREQLRLIRLRLGAGRED